MRTVFLLLFMVCFHFQSDAQIVSGCTPSPKLLKAYKRDVSLLAVQRMYDLKSPDTALVAIPTAYTDTIWSGMAAISNLIGTLQVADSVFMKYCVHTDPYADPRRPLQVLAFIDTSNSWTKKWMAYNTTTGYIELDELVNKYGFRIAKVGGITGFTYVTLETDSMVNIKAFGDSLLHFTGIYDVNEGIIIGGGDYITYTGTTDKEYTFVKAWGDCPAGCTSRIIWKFKVNSSCVVTHLSSTYQISDPFISPENCDMAPLNVPVAPEMSECSIFPNPSNGHFSIRFSSAAPVHFQLADLSGRVVKSGIAQNNQEIDVSELTSGMYMVKISSNAGQVQVLKLYKQ